MCAYVPSLKCSYYVPTTANYSGSSSPLTAPIYKNVIILGLTLLQLLFGTNNNNMFVVLCVVDVSSASLCAMHRWQHLGKIYFLVCDGPTTLLIGALYSVHNPYKLISPIKK